MPHSVQVRKLRIDWGLPQIEEDKKAWQLNVTRAFKLDPFAIKDITETIRETYMEFEDGGIMVLQENVLFKKTGTEVFRVRGIRLATNSQMVKKKQFFVLYFQLFYNLWLFQSIKNLNLIEKTVCSAV